MSLVGGYLPSKGVRGRVQPPGTNIIVESKLLLLLSC